MKGGLGHLSFLLVGSFPYLSSTFRAQLGFYKV